MFNNTIKALIKLAQSKGIKFVWSTNLTYCGVFTPHNKTVTIRKGMSLTLTEETITHEIAHALWFLASGNLGKKTGLSTRDLRKSPFFKKGLFFDVWVNWSYRKEWANKNDMQRKDHKENESFAYYMESRPELLLRLFKQL
jgi:hypothetical protein